MSNDRYRDVLIIGGGLVGASLALALRGAGCSVALFDRGTLGIGRGESAGSSRALAISPGSAEFLHALGLWAELPGERIAAVESMRIEGDRAGHVLEFSAYEMNQRALAWIVDQAVLQTAVEASLRMAEGEGAWLSLRPQAQLGAIDIEDRGVSLRLEGDEIWRGRLIVGADGLDSWVRRASCIPGSAVPYRQTAVVASLQCGRAHHGRALQWFLPGGEILALLPLPGFQVSLVWSMVNAHAAETLAAGPAALAAAVQAASGDQLGELEVLGAPAGYPLRYLRLDSVIAPRVALVGDAAHGVHPLAGQGVNLGFGDAAALAAALRDRGEIGDCGAHLLLHRYLRARRAPVAAMQFTTDGLWRLFNTQSSALSLLRNAGLATIGAISPLRRLLAQPALR